ncbi:MAG: hypothetical protein GC208_09570 [Alphaproteobacteria bacterium]|nr:hypothetical protein [Alphaproteobacteria bacterium]
MDLLASNWSELAQYALTVIAIAVPIWIHRRLLLKDRREAQQADLNRRLNVKALGSTVEIWFDPPEPGLKVTARIRGATPGMLFLDSRAVRNSGTPSAPGERYVELPGRTEAHRVMRSDAGATVQNSHHHFASFVSTGKPGTAAVAVEWSELFNAANSVSTWKSLLRDSFSRVSARRALRSAHQAVDIEVSIKTKISAATTEEPA